MRLDDIKCVQDANKYNDIFFKDKIKAFHSFFKILTYFSIITSHSLDLMYP
jgi:hypothetical protein